jgi:hypothetical protein
VVKVATDPKPSKDQETTHVGTCQRGQRSRRPPLRQQRLAKLDGEAVQHSELVELAIGHCNGNDLLLSNVRRLGLWIPRRATVIVVAVFALDMAIGLEPRKSDSSGSSDLGTALVPELFQKRRPHVRYRQR